MKKAILDLLLATVMVFAPIKATLVTVMVLTVVDLVLGIKASRKKRRKITSAGLKRTIVKVLVYEAVVMLGFLTETHLTGDLIPVVKIMGCYIGLTELTSILENIEAISGVSPIKKIIKKLNREEKD